MHDVHDDAIARWQMWKETPKGKALDVAYAFVTHPTQPESSSGGDKTKLAEATKKLLKNWNAGLQTLAPAIKNPDRATTLVLYDDAWADGDRLQIPEMDLPAGLPDWMRLSKLFVRDNHAAEIP